MTREELIEHLEHLEKYTHYSEDAPALREVIEMLAEVFENSEQLPPAQPDHIAEASKKVDADVISRREAIDGKISIQRTNGVEMYPDEAVPVEYLKALPPAQPEVRTQMSSADWQAAIEALKALEEKPKALEDDYDFGRRQMLETCIDIIQDLQPSTSAQPEIIKCRDCKFAHITYRGEVKYCDMWFPDESHYMDTDNFCSFAERREE